jgi:hypothetical protein
MSPDDPEKPINVVHKDSNGATWNYNDSPEGGLIGLGGVMPTLNEVGISVDANSVGSETTNNEQPGFLSRVGQTIGNIFKKIGDSMTGGIWGTADNGQGQETRKGDGSNKKTDLSPLTSSMPDFDNIQGKGTSNTQNSQSSTPQSDLDNIKDKYILYTPIEDELDQIIDKQYKTKGAFEAEDIRTGKPYRFKYWNSDDSTKTHKRLEADTNIKIKKIIQYKYE